MKANISKLQTNLTEWEMQALGFESQKWYINLLRNYCKTIICIGLLIIVIIQRTKLNRLPANSLEQPTVEDVVNDPCGRESKFSKLSFCYNGRLLPSIIGIGTQKCGTTTMDGIMAQFSELHHGYQKEHHFFEHYKEEDPPDKYFEKFRKCNKPIIRSFEYSGNYTNPQNNSPENLRRYYDKLGLPTEEIIFISMVCDPAKRMESAWYFQTYKYNFHNKKDPVLNEYNSWVDYMFAHRKNGDFHEDPGGIFQRGYYDEIYTKWFNIFPNNTFLIINSYYSFQHQQEVADILANVAGFEKRTISTEAKNRSKKKKVPVQQGVAKKLEEHFRPHLKRFVKILQNKPPKVMLVPETGFFEGWSGVDDNI